MKTFRLAALVAVIIMNSCATSAVASGSGNAENVVVTDDCMANISLFGTACKQKNYADALAPWESVYKECPRAHVNIYIQGVQIVNWQISQAKDAAEKEMLFNKLMTLFDQRIEYFTNGSKVKKAQVLTMKGQYYLMHKPQDKATVYPWFKEVVEVLGVKSSVPALQQYLVTSSEIYNADNSLKVQFVNDYFKANEILEQIVANPNAKNLAKYQELKHTTDKLFFSSSAASCETLSEVYTVDVIESRKTDAEFLLKAMRIFKGLKCDDLEAYFIAAQYSHEIEPNPESAMGLAAMSFKKGEVDAAIEYFTEAEKLYEKNEDKADALFKIAQCYYEINKFSKVREYCKKSIKMNSAQGAPYMLLGVIYANAGKVSDDNILNRAKYWVAVDQFIKAKTAEPTDEMIKNANKMISNYSPYYPSKEDVFMHPALEEGKSYTVGSWISETTTVRAKR